MCPTGLLTLCLLTGSSVSQSVVVTVFLQRENKEPKGLKIFSTSPKMVGLEIVSAGEDKLW